MSNPDCKGRKAKGLNFQLPKGEVRGTALVRDKDGKVKGELLLGEGKPQAPPPTKKPFLGAK